MASWRAAKTQQLQKQYAQRVRALRALRAPYGAKPRAISLKESLKAPNLRDGGGRPSAHG
jgi:hypothetical protein